MIQYPGALAISGLRAKEKSLTAGYVAGEKEEKNSASDGLATVASHADFLRGSSRAPRLSHKRLLRTLIGSLTNDDAEGNEDGKKSNKFD